MNLLNKEGSPLVHWDKSDVIKGKDIVVTSDKKKVTCIICRVQIKRENEPTSQDPIR
jgi:predicted Mrr-cat superfamily restriction endonuclease